MCGDSLYLTTALPDPCESGPRFCVGEPSSHPPLHPLAWLTRLWRRPGRSCAGAWLGPAQHSQRRQGRTCGRGRRRPCHCSSLRRSSGCPHAAGKRGPEASVSLSQRTQTLPPLDLPPSGLCTTQTLPALLPWGRVPWPTMHLVVPRHGPAPLQEHVLNAADGCPRGLGVPEQGRGARGCPVHKGQRRSGQRGGRVPSGRSPSPRCQSSCWGSGCSYCPSGLPPTDCPTNPAPTIPRPHLTPQTCLRWLCGSGHGAPGAGQGLTPCALVPCLSSSPVREGAPWGSGTRRWVKIHCMEKFGAR